MTDASVVIGRFQPFHNGHAHLIEEHAGTYTDQYIGIGVADVIRSPTDPLTYQERETILTRRYPDATVFRVDDQHDDEAWMQEIEPYVPNDAVAVTGNNHVAACFDAAGYQVDHLDTDGMLDRDIYSGTNIRKRARNEEAWRHLVPDDVEEALDDMGFNHILDDVEG